MQDKVVVRADEIDPSVSEPHVIADSSGKAAAPIPLWARIVLSLLVPVLPLLCVIALVLKIASRAQPLKVRNAMSTFLSTLLAISGLLSTVEAVLVVSLVPIPAIVSTGLPSLDERTDFPVLPSQVTLTSTDVSGKLKPLVIVVSPTIRLWNRQEVASQSFGAGMLLEANENGYLFATAQHITGQPVLRTGGSPSHAMVATSAGVWSNADIIATAKALDLTLLWVPRHSGQSRFVQPIAEAVDGEEVFVIGHPEGLKYTLSTGIVSGLREDVVQISAAISPGNSGGPVYDVHGQLLGIVSSKFDHNRDANAENLGFAARAETLRDLSRWAFYGKGREMLTAYVNDLKTAQSAPQEIVKAAESTEQPTALQKH